MADKKNMLWMWVYTIPSDTEKIPSYSASDSLGWISTDWKIELMRGRLLIGTEETANGFVKGHGYGYTADGTTVHFRKINTKIQYYNGSTWADIVTGLTSTAEYTFSRYQSLAGTFVYATWADGIYKIHTAFPWSYTSMYNAAKNFKGKSIISTGRMFMWDVTAGTSKKDTTGLYGSYIDAQDATVYTTVSGEVIADTASGTLAFKSTATRTCFGVSITDTSSGEVFTDNYLGVLTGSLGGTGTINYTTGAFTTNQSGAGTATYQWEDSNAKWVTDFTYSSTRLAGEGFVFRQDEGGDPIQNVTEHNGSYYSLKSRSAYILTLTNDDTNATNNVFKKGLGIEYWRSTVTTGQGIIFMDTANKEKPRLTILTPNQLGDTLVPVDLAPQFEFGDYEWDMCAMGTFWEYIVFSGRTPTSSTNNRLFLYDYQNKSVDILPYFAKTILDIEGDLFIGDTTTDNVYQIFSGWDDDGLDIENYWISGDEFHGTQRLKKTKRFRIRGKITPSQSLEVYVSPDGSTFTQIWTILGNWTYVDTTNTFTIGESGIGDYMIWWEESDEMGANYFAELNFAQWLPSKYRKRTIKLVATGIGYISVEMYEDFKVMQFENRIPRRFRSKQNVSLNWQNTDV